MIDAPSSETLQPPWSEEPQWSHPFESDTISRNSLQRAKSFRKELFTDLEEDYFGKTDSQPSEESRHRPRAFKMQEPFRGGDKQFSFKLVARFWIGNVKQEQDGTATHLGDGVFVTAGHNILLHPDNVPGLTQPLHCDELFVFAGGAWRRIHRRDIRIKDEFKRRKYRDEHDLALFVYSGETINISGVRPGWRSPVGDWIVVQGFPAGSGELQYVEAPLSRRRQPRGGLFSYKDVGTVGGMSGGAVLQSSAAMAVHLGLGESYAFGLALSQTNLEAVGYGTGLAV